MLKGRIENLSNKEYHDNRSHVSSSVIKLALKDPAEYKRIYVDGGEPNKENEANLLIGNFMHTWLLEENKLWEEYVIYSGSVKRGHAWELFKHENQDKEILSQSQYLTCQNLHMGFCNSKVILDEGEEVYGPALFQDGKPEVSIFTKLREVPVKIRMDYEIIKEGNKYIIRDLKTASQSANTKDEVTLIINEWDYQLSAALYADALKQYLDENSIPYTSIEFQWVFLSKKDNKLNLYRASKETLEKGRQMYITGLELIKEWKTTGNYPVSYIREV